VSSCVLGRRGVRARESPCGRTHEIPHHHSRRKKYIYIYTYLYRLYQYSLYIYIFILPISI
jgi:hypothetical protein